MLGLSFLICGLRARRGRGCWRGGMGIVGLRSMLVLRDEVEWVGLGRGWWSGCGQCSCGSNEISAFSSRTVLTFFLGYDIE